MLVRAAVQCESRLSAQLAVIDHGGDIGRTDSEPRPRRPRPSFPLSPSWRPLLRARLRSPPFRLRPQRGIAAASRDLDQRRWRGTCDALLSLQLSRSRLDGLTHLLPRAERRPARFEAADDPSRRHLWTLQLNARANGFGVTLRSNRRLQGCSSIGPVLLHDSAPCVRPERRARVAGLLSGSAWLPVENRFPRA
jgi:hypothetical protein